MKSAEPERLILGDGPVVRVLGCILGCRFIGRKADDSGWDWPKGGSGAVATLVLVATCETGLSRLVRLHSDAWRSSAAQIRCLIFGLPQDMIEKLKQRDVFGRIGEYGESFADWSECVGMVDSASPLAQCLAALNILNSCPVSAWQTRARAASCIGPLIAAIQSRDSDALLRALPNAASTDWDSICFQTERFQNAHAHANDIGKWLRAVTAAVTPDWNRGEKLFASFASSRP